MAGSPVETLAGLLLVFVLPGFAISRATFPEWRFRGPEGLTRVVETAALSLALSVGVTVLVGFGLLNLPGTGFAATWADPVLEAILAGVTAIGLVAAWGRGAFRPVPPPAPILESAPGDENAWETLRHVDLLAREQRRLRHSLRRASDEREAERLRSELARVGSEIDVLRAAREAEYAR